MASRRSRAQWDSRARLRDNAAAMEAIESRVLAPAGDADRFDRAFSRAAGAPLTLRNSVRLLLDARENFPAWLDAIRGGAALHPVRELHHRGRPRRPRVRGSAGAKGARRRAACTSSTTGSGRPSSAARGRRCARPAPTCAASIRRASTARSRGSRAITASPSSSTARSGFVSGLCVSAKWEGDPARAARAVARHRGGDCAATP